MIDASQTWLNSAKVIVHTLQVANLTTIGFRIGMEVYYTGRG